MIVFLIKIFLSFAILLVLIYFLPDKTAEIITFLAVLVALFRDRIEHFYFRPKLVLRLSDPPSNYAEVEARNPKTGEYVETHASMGVVVENTGMGKARNVMLYFHGTKSNVIDNFDRYKSLPMVRSWTRESSIASLPSRVPIRFDIGYVNSKLNHGFYFNLMATPTGLFPVKCETQVKSKFEFVVQAICDNSKKVSAQVEIEFMGSYTEGLKLYIKSNE
jgi:hypothetical protein